MTIYFLNLPSSQNIVRRYMCSSFPAGGFLFPPHDILALVGIAKNTGNEVLFTDSVAEKLDLAAVKARIDQAKPHLVISLTSFELYDEDMFTVKTLKAAFPNTMFGLFGHYPTTFAEETLQHSQADFVMLGEPDHIFERLLQHWTNQELPTDVLGTVVRTSNNITIRNGEDRRVPNPNILPMPPYEMLKSELYREHFMPHPLGVIQTARGCPFKCNYCVHSFGVKLTVLTPENVLEHILFLKQHNGIKALRFIDDTFTAIPSRVIKICKLMVEHRVNLPWTCLSRADTLDEEMLFWMKKAGCVRINVGMESGSQRILDILDKGLNVDQSLLNLQKARKAGLELMGFFLTGIPGETDDDIEQSIRFAKKAFHYVVADTLKIYPGTPLFEKMGHLVTFSLLPYKNDFTDTAHDAVAEKRRSRFYRSFYLSGNFLLHSPKFNFFRIAHLQAVIPYVIKMALNRNRTELF